MKLNVSKNKIKQEREKLMEMLAELDPITDRAQYEVLLNDISRLTGLICGDRRSIDPNTVLSILGTFGSLLLIMNYEKDNILNAKALSFVKKP